MSPKAKILLVAGTLVAINVGLAVFLLGVPTEHAVVNDTPPNVPEGIVNNTETARQEEVIGNDRPIEYASVPHATHTEPSLPLAHVTVPVSAASTVLDAMRAYEKVSDNFSFSGKEYPGLGLFVEEINGVQPTDGRYWMLYVNGKQAAEGVSTLDVTPGDTVEWRYGASIK